MPTITTRGNITATAYGFGKVGGGALGSYYLVTIADSGGSYGYVQSMVKTSLSGIAFSATNSPTNNVNFYGVLSNKGTLNWSQSLSIPSGSSGAIGYDDASKIYMFGRGNIESGYFDESSGAWTNISFTTGTGLYYNSFTGSIKPVGSYIYIADACYDSSYSYVGFGGLYQPLTAGTGYEREFYSTTYTSFSVYCSQVIKTGTSTAVGIVGGRSGNNAIGPLFSVFSYSSSNIPTYVLGLYIQNSNSGYISSSDAIVAAVTDSSNNSYVMAVFQYDASGNYGFFRSIYKIDAGGTVLWARRLPNGGGSYGGKAVLDSLGNVYFAISDGSGVMITKYTTSGTFVWDRYLNLGTSQNAPSIETDDLSFWAKGNVNSGKAVILRAPADGSKTGTYGGYAYSVGQTSDSAFTQYTKNFIGTSGNKSFTTNSLSRTASSYSPTIVKTTV